MCIERTRGGQPLGPGQTRVLKEGGHGRRGGAWWSSLASVNDHCAPALRRGEHVVGSRRREPGADDLDERIGRAAAPPPCPASFAGGATEPIAGSVPNVLALQRAAGNRAATLAVRRSAPSEVVQPGSSAPVVQRDALPEYKSTDPVVELKSVVRPAFDAWQLTVEGDFTTSEAVGRLIWPSRSKPPPGVSITPIPLFVSEVWGWPAGQEKKRPPTIHVQRAIFELTGVALFTLKTMDPLFARLFTDLGLVEESTAIRDARAAFRSRHDSLGQQVLDNIDAALKRVTMNNPGLLEAYYTFYSGWKLTGDIDSSSSSAGNTDQTVRRGGFTDINAGILHLMKVPKIPSDDTLSLLGETLIHEYAHTAHASDILKGPGEGKAYGIENFFAERLGDKQRDEGTADLGPRMGDKEAFNVSYFVMKRLYEVIDGGESKLASLKGMSPQRARELSVEFVSKNKDGFSAELKRFIIVEWSRSGYNSLPSQESG